MITGSRTAQDTNTWPSRAATASPGQDLEERCLVDEHPDPSNPLNAPAQRRTPSPRLVLLHTWPYCFLLPATSRVKLRQSPHWEGKALLRGIKPTCQRYLQNSFCELAGTVETRVGVDLEDVIFGGRSEAKSSMGRIH